MGKKLYEETPQGGIKFTSHRMGEVRVPNYVYDIWLPILGARGVAVYSVYCRLEREGTVKAITQADIAKACRIGPATLKEVNQQLEECGFIKVTEPTGYKKLAHFTTEIDVYSPPTEVPAAIIEKYQHAQGYKALSTWLVADTEAPELLPSSSEETEQSLDEKLPSSSNVASLGLNPLEVVKKHGANAPLDDSLSADDPPEQGPAGEAALDGCFGPRKKPKAEPVKSDGDWTKAAAEVPWRLWGNESEELQRQKRKYGPNAEPVLKLGYELDRALGLRPVWKVPKKVKTWTSGLHACLLAADWDAALVLTTARKMREDKLTIKSPWSIEGMVEAAAAEKRSGSTVGSVFGRLEV